MLVFNHYHRVRYRECDPMRIVYHTNYVDYLEYGRTEAFRDLGMSYDALEKSGVYMPVVELSLKYKSSALYDDELEIRTYIKKKPSVKCTFDYEIRRKGEDQILLTATVTLCFMDSVRHRPVRAPKNLLEVFDKAILASSNI